MSAYHVAAFEVLQDLRRSTTRAHLAASELVREVVTPHARDLVARVLDATRAIDAGVEVLAARESEAALAERRAHERASMPASETTLCELYERLAPALAARGLRWEPPNPITLPGVEAVVLRRLASSLLSLAARCAEPGGEIRLDGYTEAGRIGLRLALESEGGRVPLPVGPELHEALRGCRAGAVRVTQDGAVQVDLGPSAGGATPIADDSHVEEDPPCVAS